MHETIDCAILCLTHCSNFSRLLPQALHLRAFIMHMTMPKRGMIDLYPVRLRVGWLVRMNRKTMKPKLRMMDGSQAANYVISI